MDRDEDDYGRNDPAPRDFDVLEDIAELRKRGLEDLLTEAHKELLVDLLAKLRAGQASHQELAILRNLLRDNGLMMPPRTPEQMDRDAARPPADLPTFEDPEYEN